MATDPTDASDLKPDNIIPVTFDDLSEDDRQALEQELKAVKAEKLKLYLKTRNGVVKRVTAPSPSRVLDTKVQSAIDDGRLIFTESSKMKLDTDPFPVNVIDFENKKMLIRSDQTESARGKNVVVDNNAPPSMIKPKNPVVGVWKVNGTKRQAPRPKPTVSMLLEKYTSRKADNVFNRLGGNKRPRSPTRPEGHELGKEISITISLIFQWHRHIGAAYLLCVLSIFRGASIRGCHILQDQQVIFNRIGFQQDLRSHHICMRKELVSIRRLDHVMPL